MKKLVLIFAPLAAALAQERFTVNFSDPNRPGTVRAELVDGSITVTGTTGKDVIVEQRGRERRERERDREQPTTGMRRIYSGGAGLTISEENNVVRISSDGSGRGQDLHIQVPQRTSLVVKTVNSGHLRVENVEGEVEASNVNGSVEIQSVSGTVIANTVNGKILVVFNRVTPGKPMSFTTLNGQVDVTFPADMKATIRMKTENGEVYTDFDLPVKTESKREEVTDRRGIRRWKVETAAVAALNGGGPEVRLETMNGRIYIRKK